MHTSENINELATALAKAQAELKNPSKDSENPHFRNRYADLSSGLNAVRPVLSRHGIAVVQMTRMADDVMMLETRLIHSSGQWIESTYPVCKFPTKHQEAGSALTYSRRYSLFSLVGIAGEDEDDDGNEGSKAPTPAPARRPTPAVERKPAPASGPTLSASESATARAAMLMSLDFCETRESLHEWAKANKATKDLLSPEDQQLVAEAFKSKQVAVQTFQQVAE